MKGHLWTLTLVTFASFFPGIFAPATYFIKNLDETGSYKNSVYHPKRAVSSIKQHVYPAHTQYIHPDSDLTSQFIKEISEFKIPQEDLPERIPVEKSSEEEDYERDYDKPDYEQTPDYNAYNEEYSDSTEAAPSFRDYSESGSGNYEGEVLSNYKVTETIPGDTKYKMPKVKVVPIPPPCLRPAPPPPPKPKPTDELLWSNSGHPYRIQASPSKRYRYRRKPKISSPPYIISKFRAPEGANLVIRHHTILPPPPPLRKPKPIVKEVHIHHHHTMPSQMVPVALHIHKEAMEPSSSEPEDKRLDSEFTTNYYTPAMPDFPPDPLPFKRLPKTFI